MPTASTRSMDSQRPQTRKGKWTSCVRKASRRLPPHTLSGVIKLPQELRRDRRENLAVMVCFIGPLLAGGNPGPRALALDLAAVAAVPPHRYFVRGDICIAAGDLISSCACSWVPRQPHSTRALAEPALGRIL